MFATVSRDWILCLLLLAENGYYVPVGRELLQCLFLLTENGCNVCSCWQRIATMFVPVGRKLFEGLLPLAEKGYNVVRELVWCLSC